MSTRGYDWLELHRRTGDNGDSAYADRLAGAVENNPELVSVQPVPGVADLERRVAALEAGGVDDGSVSILDYDGGPDKDPSVNVAALHDALAAADAVRFGPGVYLFDAPVSLVGLRGKRLLGSGKWSTFLNIVGDAPAFLDLGGAQDCGIKDLRVTHSGAFGGVLVKLGSDGEGMNSSLMRVDVFGPWSDPVRTATGVSLDRSHGHKLRDCVFAQLRFGVTGMQSGGWSNAQLIEGCKFYRNEGAHITNGGSAWSVTSCIIEESDENLTDRAFRFVDYDLTGRLPRGMRFVGLWHGDVNNGVGFEVAGSAWLFSGHLGLWTVGDHVAIKAVGPVDGLDCSGAVFKGGDPGVAVDLGNRLVSRFKRGAYGELTNPVIGVER